MTIKRKTVYIGILFIIGIFFLLFVSLSFFYLKQIAIYQPFSVSISGITPQEAEKIEINGITPFNHKRTIFYNSDYTEWNSNGSFFLKTIELNIPDSIESQVDQIIISSEQVRFAVALNELQVVDTSGKKHSYFLPAHVRNTFSLGKMISYIIKWKAVQKFGFLCIVAGCFLLFIFLFLWLKNRIKSFLFFFEAKPNKQKCHAYFKQNPLTTKAFWIIILSIYIILETVFHIYFHFATGWYLTTSGVLLIILIAAFIYFILWLLKKFFHLHYIMRNIRLNIATTAIFLIIIEIFLMFINYTSWDKFEYQKLYYESQYVPKEKNWLHIWHRDHDLFALKEFSFPRQINSEGLSDIEHPVIKKENEYRIIGLGDSFTEGNGADADSTWLKFLERNISKYPLKKQLTYFNAGVIGSDPYFEYILLKESLLKYKPDLVLLALNVSDIIDIYLRGGMERFRPDGTVQYNPEPWWEPVYATSHVSRLFFAALGYKETVIRYKSGDFTRQLKEITDIVISFNELAKKNNFSLLVIFHPLKEEILNNDSKLDIVYQDIVKKGKPEVFNLRTYFVREEKINVSNYLDYYWPKDGHHNTKGYEAFARGVEWKLKKMGLLDSIVSK